MLNTKLLLTIFLLYINSLSWGLNLAPRQWHLNADSQQYLRKVSDYKNMTITASPESDINYSATMPGSHKVIVAILDSGLDVNHPELVDRIFLDPKCKDMNEEQRAKEFCHGVNLIDGNNDLSDKIGHGTHIAGTIAALNDNKGVSGIVKSNIKILPIKIKKDRFDSFFLRKELVSTQLARGIRFAVSKGAKIINFSFGIPKVMVTEVLTKAMDDAHDSGVVLVAAAGNNGKKRPVFPCNYKNVICVGSLDANNKPLRSSNYGHMVDVYAPGENIISIYPQNVESASLRINNYETKTGTSFASPIVASLAALMLQKDPGLSPSIIKERIIRNSREIMSIRKVDFDATLKDETMRSFVDLKDINQITIDDNRFTIKVPIKGVEGSLGTKNTIELKALNEEVYIQNPVVSLSKNQDFVEFHCELKDLDKDFSKSFVLQFNNITYPLSVDLSVNPTQQTRIALPYKDLDQIIRIGLTNKTSNLKKVFNRYSTKDGQDFYIGSNTHTKQVIVFKSLSNKYIPVVLRLSEQTNVGAIFEADVNLDGELDYVLYGVSKDNRSYLYHFFDQNGKELFTENTWKLKASNFGTIGFDRGEINFSFVKVHTAEYGFVNVPVMTKRSILNDIDNSRDPVDRLSSSNKLRSYYFYPKRNNEEIEIQLRTFENYNFVNTLRRELNLNFFDEIEINGILTQDFKQFVNGVVDVSYSVGENASKANIIIRFNGDSHKIIHYGSNFIQGNQITRARSLDDNHFADNYVLSKRYRRDFLRLQSLRESQSTIFHSDGWADPISDVIEYFNNSQTMTSFIESRYYLHMLRQDNDQKFIEKVEIDRESSFPGLQFSQSFKGVIRSGKESVFTDTKSIYGDTSGFYQVIDNKLILSVKSNFKLPRFCVSLGVSEFNGDAKLMAHCRNQKISWIETY